MHDSLALSGGMQPLLTNVVHNDPSFYCVVDDVSIPPIACPMVTPLHAAQAAAPPRPDRSSSATLRAR